MCFETRGPCVTDGVLRPAEHGVNLAAPLATHMAPRISTEHDAAEGRHCYELCAHAHMPASRL